MTLAIAAAAIACAACLACWASWRRNRVLHKELLAARIAGEEQRAQSDMDRDLARNFDDALERISEESRSALGAAMELLQSQHTDVTQWTEVLPDAVLVHRDEIIEFSNRSAQELFGQSQDQLRGTSTENWLLATEGEQLAQGDERVVTRVDGELRTVCLAEVQIDFEGAPATLLLLRDVTAQRRIEKQLRLADRMTSLGSLVAGIAHELNNPMSYVLANLEMLGDEIQTIQVPAEQAAEMKEMLAEAQEGCMRIATTVGELQRFSRPPPSGNGGSLSQIIGSACAITGSTIRSHAELTISIDDDPILAEGADQLTHVLVNLLMNATESILSTPRDGSSAHVTLRAYRQSGDTHDLIIEVADSGPGISEHLQKRIFDPFYTTRHTSKATGLGLPICYSMVAALGGNLEVQSSEGAGATMRVRLPSDLGVPSNPS